MKTKLSIAALLIAALALVGCGQSSVTLTLDLVVTAADAAVSALQATGQLPAGTATQITAYLGDVTKAVDAATAELATMDTVAEKAAKIAQAFAGIAAPVLPSGTAQAIVLTVSAVATAVANFLASVQTTSAALDQPALAHAFFGANGHWNGKLSRADRKALKDIQAKNAKVKAALASLPKRQ